ncbi:MAG TPA: hypothetical protein VFC54_03895 [Pseudolabrys sp.]|nr:hypothetical protein [Pseudolabrys sp.]
MKCGSSVSATSEIFPTSAMAMNFSRPLFCSGLSGRADVSSSANRSIRSGASRIIANAM